MCDRHYGYGDGMFNSLLRPWLVSSCIKDPKCADDLFIAPYILPLCALDKWDSTSYGIMLLTGHLSTAVLACWIACLFICLC